MRPLAVAVLALTAAAVGASVALVLGDAGERQVVSETVVVTTSEGTLAARSSPPPRAPRFDPAAIYASRAPGVVTIYAQGGGGETQGSGFLVSSEGAILTNAHVITNVADEDQRPVRGADRVYVEFADGERVPAEVVGWDLFSDLGVLTVDPAAHPLRPLALGDSGDVVVGAPVAAIGSPFGNQGSLAVGVVSATGRSIPSLTSRYAVVDAIQTDAPINRGNSGGPLLDAAGRVIGVNAQIRSESGVAEGVGFAIPVNIAKRALRQLLTTGTVTYAFVGVETLDLTPGLARTLGFGVDRGALIGNVQPGTPAEAAGLQGGSGREEHNGVVVPVGGDVIVRIAGHPVRRSEDVSRIVTERLEPGQRVEFVVFRQGRTREVVEVTLGTRSADEP